MRRRAIGELSGVPPITQLTMAPWRRSQASLNANALIPNAFFLQEPGLGKAGFVTMKRARIRVDGNSVVTKAAKSHNIPRGFNVVALGGGTGLSTVLRGLREHVMRR